MVSMHDAHTNPLNMMHKADATDDYCCQLHTVQSMRSAMLDWYVHAMDPEILRSAAIEKKTIVKKEINIY